MTVPADTLFMITYRMIDTPPITSVDTVGVRCLGWIFSNDEGMALKWAIDSVVRAVGRMVVWVDAAAELNTMRIRRWVSTLPMPDVPKTAPPRLDSTSFWL